MRLLNYKFGQIGLSYGLYCLANVVMVFRVLGLIFKKIQILWSIVTFLIINVVYNLIFFKGSANKFFNHKNVLQNISIGLSSRVIRNSDSDVPTSKFNLAAYPIMMAFFGWVSKIAPAYVAAKKHLTFRPFDLTRRFVGHLATLVTGVPLNFSAVEGAVFGSINLFLKKLLTARAFNHHKFILLPTSL